MQPSISHRVLGVPVLDVALSAVLLFASVGGLLTGEVSERPLAITLPVATVMALSMLGRTRAPLVATVVWCAADLAQAIWGSESPGTLMVLVMLLVLAFSDGAELGEGRAAVGLAILLGSSFATERLDRGSDYAFITVMLGGVWLLGRAARSLRSRATYAEQHQRDLTRLAVADERTRIARELHDVVAHGLSVIAVQADAAEAALSVDPARAEAPMRAIRSSARGALTDMRQLLHVLRTDEDAYDDRRPALGIEDLEALVRTTREGGIPVESHLCLDDALPAGIGLAVYRIVQEGLTNVRKHAGAVPTQVRLDSDGRLLRIVVSNGPGRPHPGAPSTGLGLVGVRERALATGGSVRAEPTADGGYALEAVLRLDGGDPT